MPKAVEGGKTEGARDRSATAPIVPVGSLGAALKRRRSKSKSQGDASSGKECVVIEDHQDDSEDEFRGRMRKKARMALKRIEDRTKARRAIKEEINEVDRGKRRKIANKDETMLAIHRMQWQNRAKEEDDSSTSFEPLQPS